MATHLEDLFAKYPPIMSAKDLAEVLGLNNKTVYEYLQNGDLPAYHIGSKWVIVRDEVITHIQATSNSRSQANFGAISQKKSALPKTDSE